MATADKTNTYVALSLVLIVILTGISSYVVITNTSFTLLVNGMIIVGILCVWGFIAERIVTLFGDRVLGNLTEDSSDDGSANSDG